MDPHAWDSHAAVSPTAVARATEVLGDRWSLPIVAALLARPLRYTEIQELLPGLAPNILSARLRTLEQEGLIGAERYSERPPRFQYRLTPAGRALREVLEMLSAWSDSEPARHEPCGGPLELRWWCAACESPAQPEAGEEASISA